MTPRRAAGLRRKDLRNMIVAKPRSVTKEDTVRQFLSM